MPPIFANGTGMDRGGSEELVLSFLAEAMAEYVSGDAISGKLGLSAAEVFHGVEGLRNRGYRIDAVPARGYRLVEVPDRVTELEVGPLLSTRELGLVLHHHETVSSTSEVAFELAREGASAGEVVIAEAQTAGKGRRGRTWVSPPGKNLYLSVILRPHLPPARAPELTLVAGVALAETLREGGVPARIKWPNDVVVEGAKLAGILTELATEGDRVAFVVLGIGVNLNVTAADFPAELRGIATSAREVRGHEVPRALFAAALLTRLEEWLERHEDDGFDPVREAALELSDTVGRVVRVQEDGRSVEGRAVDIDGDGALVIETAAGQRERVISGDVVRLRDG
jgi:BirA family biotin operon repressor/biotin-[acetyl-CoA-carboxylase] ligase